MVGRGCGEGLVMAGGVASLLAKLSALGTSTHPFPINAASGKRLGQLQPASIELTGVFSTHP